MQPMTMVWRARPGPTDLETCPVENLHDAWSFAAGEARSALHAWMTSDPSGRRDAYAVYVAALDREERAASVLAGRILTRD
jgi:hypothetical protein